MTTVERSYIFFIVGRAGEELLGTWTMHWTLFEEHVSVIYKFIVNGSYVHVQIMNCYTKDTDGIHKEEFTKIKDSVIVESQDEDFPFADGWKKAPRIHFDKTSIYFNKKSEERLIGKMCVRKEGTQCFNGTGSGELLL